MPPQENFRKGIYGMLHLAEIGGPSLVKAIEALEANTSGALKPNLFRGAENLIPPDVTRLLPFTVCIGKLVPTVNALLDMQASGARAKDIPNSIIKLKKDRLVSWHLENPTNDKVHPSRSMPLFTKSHGHGNGLGIGS